MVAVHCLATPALPQEGGGLLQPPKTIRTCGLLRGGVRRCGIDNFSCLNPSAEQCKEDEFGSDVSGSTRFGTADSATSGELPFQQPCGLQQGGVARLHARSRVVVSEDTRSKIEAQVDSPTPSAPSSAKGKSSQPKLTTNELRGTQLGSARAGADMGDSETTPPVRKTTNSSRRLVLRQSVQGKVNASSAPPQDPTQTGGECAVTRSESPAPKDSGKLEETNIRKRLSVKLRSKSSRPRSESPVPRGPEELEEKETDTKPSVKPGAKSSRPRSESPAPEGPLELEETEANKKLAVKPRAKSSRPRSESPAPKGSEELEETESNRKLTVKPGLKATSDTTAKSSERRRAAKSTVANNDKRQDTEKSPKVRLEAESINTGVSSRQTRTKKSDVAGKDKQQAKPDSTANPGLAQGAAKKSALQKNVRETPAPQKENYEKGKDQGKASTVEATRRSTLARSSVASQLNELEDYPSSRFSLASSTQEMKHSWALGHNEIEESKSLRRQGQLFQEPLHVADMPMPMPMPEIEEPSRRGGEVKLHVYHLHNVTKFTGLPIFHLGVEIYNFEHYFCNDAGITWCHPGDYDSRKHKKVQTLGSTRVSAREVWTVLDKMKPDWPGSSYSLRNHNCQTFAVAFCRNLGLDIPHKFTRFQEWGISHTRSASSPPTPGDSQPVRRFSQY